MMILLVPILFFFALAMIVLGVMQTQSQNQVQARVENLQTAIPESVLHQGSDKKLDASFTQRVVIPLAQSLSDKIQMLIPLSGKSWIRQKLMQAGYMKSQHIKTFMGVHCITTFAPILLVLFLIIVAHSVSAALGFLLLVFLGGMGFAMPLLWLIQQAVKRQDSIRKALPDFLDLLVICVEAGLGLDTAISKISRTEAVQTSEYLRDELLRYIKDISLGKPRKEALLGLAHRTGVEDLNTIVNALVQSFEMGTGIVQALKVQSDGLRQKRLHRAEAAANKISVKMVMPIYLFFFPGIFIVILGPMVLYTIKQITMTMHNVHDPTQ
jgi:tight adherence protein C